jgi:hypothetical protein
MDVQRGREIVHVPSLGPRTMSPRTDSTVKTLGAKGVSPPQRFASRARRSSTVNDRIVEEPYLRRPTKFGIGSDPPDLD